MGNSKDTFVKTWQRMRDDHKVALKRLWEHRAAKIGLELPERGNDLVEYVWELYQALRAARGKLK